MSRIHGLNSISENYEVKLRRPLDARMLVPTKADLINPASWTAYTYNGMIVAVGADSEAFNNGIYILKDRKLISSSDYSGWSKVAELTDLNSLKIQVADLEEIVNGLDSRITQEQLNKAITDLKDEITSSGYLTQSDLENYVIKSELEEVKEAIPSIEGLAQTTYVDEEINKLKDLIPSTEGLASEQYVQDEISKIVIPDVTGKADKEDV